MEDSDKPEQAPAQEFVKEEKKSTESIIVRRGGRISELLIDPKTKRFMKKPKKLPSSYEVIRMMRNKANERVVGPDGRILKGSKIEIATEHVLRIARGEAEGDPKAHMAAITAYKEVCLRMYGKYAINEADKDDDKYQGLRIVVVSAPEGLQVAEEETRKVRQPAFLDGEVVSTNPATNQENGDAEKIN